MKKCPYCAEEIQEEAIVCKHCGRELAPGAVAVVSQDLAHEAQSADEHELIATEIQNEQGASPTALGAQQKRPIWVSAIRAAVVFVALFIIYEIVQVLIGRSSWEQFLENLGWAILVRFMTVALLTAVGIWIWRAISSPLPSESQIASDPDEAAPLDAQEQAADPGGTLEDSEPLIVDQSGELASTEPQGEKIYPVPEGLVAAPNKTKNPIWRGAAGIGGAFAALQSVLVLSGFFTISEDPGFTTIFQPVWLILSIPVVFGIAFSIAAMVMLGWRYVRLRM